MTKTIETLFINFTRDTFADEVGANINPEGMYFSYRLLKLEDNGTYRLRVSRNSNHKLNKMKGSWIIEDATKNLEQYTDGTDGEIEGISFAQPDIETMIIAYHPMMLSIAKELSHRFYNFSNDDILQEIRIAMFRIKQSGMYLHRSNIKKYTETQLFKILRDEAKHAAVRSLDEGVEEGCSMYDILPDETAEEEAFDREKHELNSLVFQEVKDFIINKYGERQFEELLFEYEYRIASEWARKLVGEIRKALVKNGMSKTMILNNYV